MSGIQFLAGLLITYYNNMINYAIYPRDVEISLERTYSMCIELQNLTNDTDFMGGLAIYANMNHIDSISHKNALFCSPLSWYKVDKVLQFLLLIVCWNEYDVHLLFPAVDHLQYLSFDIV